MTRRERLTTERVSSPAARPMAHNPPSVPVRTVGGHLGSLSLRGALVVGTLVVGAYLPALEAGFVWDDTILVNESVIHDWSGLWKIWFSPTDIEREAHYWPVVYTSFWIEHKLWGLAPLGYHAVNVLLHLVNVLLIWHLLARLAVPGAWTVAAVFAVHPLHVESVVWVIERKDVLSALFYLTAAGTWIRYTVAPRPGRYLLALGLFTAALLSKSIVVTLPAALIIWHWWQAGRITRTDIVRLAPMFAIAFAVTAADLAFYASREPLDLGYSLAERVLIASRALWFYVGKLLWPTDLIVIYPLWEISAADPVAWTYLLAAAALAAFLWLGRRRFGRGPVAGALFFAVTLSPVLGFVDYGYMQFSLVADRFQYLAGLGVLAVLLGAAAHGAARLQARTRRLAAVVLAVVLALLGTLTWLQARIYRDGITFFSHIVAHNPNARDAHLNLVAPLAEAGRLEEALAAARIGVERRPDRADAYVALASVLVKLEQFDEADSVLRTALQLAPGHPGARQNLGEALRRRGRYGEAIEMYHAALEADPDLAPAHGGLGLSLVESGHHGEALAALERALALDPDAPSAGKIAMAAGRAAVEAGRLDAADAYFRRAASLESSTPVPLTELSNLLAAQGRRAEAEDYLRRAHEARPNDPAAFHLIGEVLRTAGRRDEAVASYREALRIDPEFAPAQVGIGAALLDGKRYDEALESLDLSFSSGADAATAATAHYLAGRTLLELGRNDEAAAHFQRTIELDPDHAEALDHLALWRFGRQEYEQALALYRVHADLAPDDPTVHANTGVTLYFLGRRDEALASLERALQLDPTHNTARRLAAELRAAAARSLQ
ncbi:MAG: tetratricopeptide repeat protein [Bryobacterales bacterium]|nr:tetratricopeptide repeat protein [Bryobacterales bacterium]